MNPNNYATLEASKRLVEAEIVLETEAQWSIDHLVHRKKPWASDIPAPSVAEVLRELPDSHGPSTTLILEKHNNEVIAGYFDWDEEDFIKPNFRSANPTDALIDLLIWVRGKEE